MTHALPILDARHGRPPTAPDVARHPGRLIDAHGRTIRDLRLSVTDRCNYRCVYCMDPDHRYLPKRALLSSGEYLTLARVATSLGVRKIRITGGEPTLYRDLEPLMGGLGALGLDDLAMTTNGSMVTPARAARWKSLGLDRLTFSLDSLREDRVHAITRSKTAAPSGVVAAIAAARDAGLAPIKINAVIVRGVNDDEIPDFADFARTHAIDMRLIEWMPLDSGHTWQRAEVVTADEMITAIRGRHDLVPLDRGPSETSLNFGFADGAPGRIGIIASVTRAFCGACSRLRATADGKIRPCLFSHEEWDVRALLRAGADDEAIARFLVDAVWTKQAGHGIDAATFRPPERGMSAIGG